MGNRISVEQQLIQDLQKRITQLENVDKNGDGFVSKEEYDDWTTRQEKDLLLFKDTILKIQEKKHSIEIEKLQTEISSLKRINTNLESRLTEKYKSSIANNINNKETTESNIKTNTQLFGELSRQYIDEEINKILAKPEVNVNIIPDYYERMIYRNIFNMFFGLIENLTNNSSIKFLHHTISFSIKADDSSLIGNSKLIVDDNSLAVNGEKE